MITEAPQNRAIAAPDTGQNRWRCPGCGRRVLLVGEPKNGGKCDQCGSVIELLGAPTRSGQRTTWEALGERPL